MMRPMKLAGDKLMFGRGCLAFLRQLEARRAMIVTGGRSMERSGILQKVRDYLAQAGAFIVPLRAGGGMRVKILNAMAQALPIVSTTIGAEGIEIVPGEHLLLADTPAEFAAAVLRLLDDPPLAQAIGARGRALAVARYDYRRACCPLAAAYTATPATDHAGAARDAAPAGGC